MHRYRATKKMMHMTAAARLTGDVFFIMENHTFPACPATAAACSVFFHYKRDEAIVKRQGIIIGDGGEEFFRGKLETKRWV